MRNLIKIQKKCEWCGKEFTAYKCSTKFCCKKCNDQSYKDDLRKKKVQESQKEIWKSDVTKELGDVSSKEYLTPTQTAKLLGVGRATLYRYLMDNVITSIQFKGKTLIRRQDIDKLFDDSHPYQKRHKKERAPITEFYTTAEIVEKYHVTESWIFVIAKRENIPRVFQRGKTLWSKKHIDAYFTAKAPDATISEWYSVKDVMEKFNMSIYAVYTFVSKNNIPKKKDKREVFYSKKHIELAKGIIELEKPQYYTIPEAMARFNMTRDQIYHYAKFHNIPKIKEGKYTKLSKKDFDDLLAPPII